MHICHSTTTELKKLERHNKTILESKIIKLNLFLDLFKTNEIKTAKGRGTANFLCIVALSCSGLMLYRHLYRLS